jgi:DNA-binding PadR family transcriptional regulator
MGKVSPLALAVLGLLGERPRHPYEVAFVMRQRHMDEHIKLNLGTLYHTFEQLQRAGWIEPTETAREGRRPERTVYSLTEAGSRRFRDRLRELISEPSHEYSSFEAGLSFMHQLGPEEAVELLRMRAIALEQRLDAGEQILGWLRSRGLTRLSLIEAEMVQDQHRWQVGWVRRIADEIESGELEWSAGISEEKRQDQAEPPPRWLSEMHRPHLQEEIET